MTLKRLLRRTDQTYDFLLPRMYHTPVATRNLSVRRYLNDVIKSRYARMLSIAILKLASVHEKQAGPVYGTQQSMWFF